MWPRQRTIIFVKFDSELLVVNSNSYNSTCLQVSLTANERMLEIRDAAADSLTAWQLELRDVTAVTSVACICTLESNLWCKEQADSTECCKSKHQALTFLFCVLHFFSPQKFIHSTESTLGGVFLETENSLHVSKPNNQNAVVRPSEENPLHRVLNFSFPISSD